MTDVEQAIAATIDELDLPESDLVGRVLAELSEAPTTTTGRLTEGGWRLPALGRGFGPPRPAVALAGSFLLVVLALLVLEPARSAVADILGFGATRIEQGSDSSIAPRPTTSSTSANPATSTNPAISATPATSASSLDPENLGAENGANPIPSLGAPSITDGTIGARRRYLWPSSERFPALGGSNAGVILEVRTVSGPADLKSLGGQPGVEFVTIDVESGEVLALWIPADHQRTLNEESERSEAVDVGPTLTWTVEDLQYRLEADISKAQVVALAAEVTGGTELLATG